MDKNDMLKQVNEVFIAILDNENIVLSPSTSSGDIEEWDSLTHIQLVVGVEKKFNLRFTSKEIQSWANVGEMIDSILTKKK